ncbi:hypothetical protein LTR36_005015 [Oleoguttula mirabilis]|uniref:MSP domain-containing protein n=1 Tax=Oleoguttula mirabilis TaxID=1507867 RepID=A0AAV9JVF6_9PEZI|nr:hypothetical protein LTR36_005015 [Oleoguttula mirabilis]
MSVELEPAELGFQRPFTHEVSQVLRLHNPTSDPIAFKVKTTAPKQYCVRPNSGRIESGQNVEVSVLLQAMKEDPPPDARCRDKFLVQSVAITPDKEFGTVAQVWSNIEQTAKSSIQEKKIRVNFLPADGSAGTASSTQQEEGPPAYSSPSPSAVTPQRSSLGAVGAMSTPSDKPAGSTNRGEAVESAHNPAVEQSTLGAAAAAVTSVIPTSRDDLQRSLEAANAQIKQLQQSASEGLRQRKVTADGEKTTSITGLQNAPAPGGVPVQYVAALCLMCFLIAYMFF